ncbi:PAS domain-containing hybrid sensor histidine kinase/response regulator [Gallaecimonas xiamenensis]|uniref:histidine kinase n=1 Tax=Gallaecimonas xiamenensis 3-C-1 TaxID=745411 RepID=K2KHL5_9GAMM|nr:PAS domain-containing hybrid sensor histidine kinase/response regulator [Gallaecimonas xiamenensis]EKE76775.1 sensor histidine kinase/response regulator [Gallaecimonas xiamenensis 3-C-1]
MPLWLMVCWALGYLVLLFAIAYWGDRGHRVYSAPSRKLIYALSLAVYCSSWSFLGTVGQAYHSLWSFLPVYLGPICLFAFGYPMLKKLVRVSHAQRITSVADFLAARYGKSQLLAVTVTLIAIVASLPYIALQLKAMVMGFGLLAGESQLPETAIAASVAISLVLFASLFGTRKLDATEHHPGLMLAMAFESVIKLVALVTVALVVVYGAFDGFGELITQSVINESVGREPNSSLSAVLAQSLVGACAFVCLPRLFHVMVVESQEQRDLKSARWIFSLYLVLMALPVLPLAMAGSLIGDASQSPDGFVISLPLAQGHPWVAALALLGAISASTSMVVMAAVTIAIMVSNELVIPLMLRTGKMAGRNFERFSTLLLRIRRFIILVLLALGFATYWLLGQQEQLAGFGLFAFGAFAQLAPALVGGLYWSQGHRKGVFLGLVAGFAIWWSLSSVMLSSYAIVISLLVNAMTYVLASMAMRAGVRDRLQAAAFVAHRPAGSKHQGYLSVTDLRLLVSRFVGPERAEQMLRRFMRDQGITLQAMPRLSPDELLSEAERLMASVIGASSAALVLRSAMEGRDIGLDEVVTLVDEATEQLHFSRDLLQGAIEHASEGMSVVDRDLNLVAWNRRYLELFEYPPGFIYAGRPVADLIRFNAERGWCGRGSVAEHVDRRVNFMKMGSPHSSERERPDGRVIKLQGNPMPNGGFVMTFSDITPYRDAERVLKNANEELEARVAERTRELVAAKAAADKANQGKSRFLAACGHDLMQPLNAARLFVSALLQRTEPESEQALLLDNTKASLKAAGELLTDLLDISKLDAGTMKVRRVNFPLDELLGNLAHEFKALAVEQQISFQWVGSKAVVDSDKMLLRRIIQNFLTNAFRYAKGGKVLLGARHQGRDLCIEVWDTGPGIAQEHLASIFEEFKRFDKGEKGLGLGLAIADRMSRILGHTLAVRSWEGRGSVFSVRVPRGQKPSTQAPALIPVNGRALTGRHVLCIDNEKAILEAMRSLLTGWNMKVSTARSREEAQAVMANESIDMVLADYHLDGGDDGLSVMQLLRKERGGSLPGILITADTRQELISETQQAGFGFMAKMVKPAALRAMMDQALARGSARR